MLVAVDLVHSESMVSADVAGLSAKSVTLDGMTARLTLKKEEVAIFFRLEDFPGGVSLL
jgi:hypothetical protein